MTDRELLEMAAKAAGVDVYCNVGTTIMRSTGVGNFIAPWNPLTDDGDALRLAVKLTGSGFCMTDLNVPMIQAARNNEDLYAATRRAIVRAAAEIGKNNT